jgi:glutamine synthetase
MSIKVDKEICVWAEYGWTDGSTSVEGPRIRSKGRFVFISPDVALDFKSYPEWSFDGSSTGQATTNQSDVILKPVKVVIDPSRNRPQQMAVLVWCDCWNTDGTPHETNHRQKLKDIILDRLEWIDEQEPMFGIEQEYQLHFYNNPDKPLMSEPQPQGLVVDALSMNMYEDAHKLALFYGELMQKLHLVNGNFKHGLMIL